MTSLPAELYIGECIDNCYAQTSHFINKQVMDIAIAEKDLIIEQLTKEVAFYRDQVRKKRDEDARIDYRD